MNIWQITKKALGLQRNDALDNFLRKPFRSYQADEPLTELKALQSTAVFGCVRIISETVAWLPLPIYRRLTNGGKAKAADYDLYNLLQTKPNTEMTSFTFRETLNSHLMLYGNAYAEIEFDSGRPVGLWILPPDRVNPERTKETKELFYEINLPNGTMKRLQAYRVLHIPGLGFDGIKGYSPIQLLRRSINLSLALDQFGYDFFKNGTNVGSVVTSPNALSDKAYERLKSDLSEKYEGLGKAHRLMLLEEGMTFAKNTIPPNDAQFLESRKFQITDIARIYRVPPHMLADLERATFANIEHQDLSFVKHTMMPYFRRWEQAINIKIIPEADQKTYFAEFLVDGLLRGDIATRYTAYQTALQNGWFNRNEIREMENHNRMPNDELGDMYTVNAATVGLESLLQTEEPEPPPERNPPDDEENEDRASLKCDCGETHTKLLENRSWMESHKHHMQVRNAKQRTKIAKSFESIFNDAITRIVKREKADIKRHAEKVIGQRSVEDLVLFINQFFDKHEEFIRKNIAPPYASLTQAIKASAIQEINGKDVDTDQLVRDMIDVFTNKYSGRTRKSLISKITKTFQDGEDVLEMLDEEFAHREEMMPKKYSEEETLGAASAVSKFVWAASGITLLRWVTQGSKTCEFCQQLDGKIVGIDKNFIGSNENLSAEGNQMKISGPKSHPPIHTGCECSISPE